MSVPLVIVGEAWGEDEAALKHPFVGKAGVELYTQLCDAGFPLERITKRFVAPYSMRKLWAASGIHLLNVFNRRPPKNNIDAFFTSDEAEAALDLPKRRGKYVHLEVAQDVRDLFAELEHLKPNLIVTLGNTPMWALLGLEKISAEAGSIHLSSHFGKVLPIYHPAYILRTWQDRPLAIAAFIKARREMESPDFQRRSREVWVEPTLEDLDLYWDRHLAHAPYIVIDIETERAQTISEVGFAASPTSAIHIPFLVGTKKGTRFISCKSYWATPEDEVAAWRFVHRVCSSPIPKILQNGMYDIYWLWCKMHIPVMAAAEDTMLLHHALYPELKKGLGLLGAIYSNEPSWKHLRRESNKPDE